MNFRTEGRDLLFYAGELEHLDLVCYWAQVVLMLGEVLISVGRWFVLVRISPPRNVGELIEPLFKARRKLGQPVGFIAIPPRSVSREAAVRYLFEGWIIGPRVQISRIIGFFHVVPGGRCLYALCCSLLQDDCIEPVAQR